jgi:hypothetical protein
LLPLVAFDVSHCELGAAVALDVSLAFEDPAKPSLRLQGLMDATATASLPPFLLPPSAEDASAPTAAAPPASAASGATPSPPRAVAYRLLPGALCQLQYLNMSGCGLSTMGVAPLLEAVAQHAPCLRALSLRGNLLDDTGAGQVATAILANHTRIRKHQKLAVSKGASARVFAPLEAIDLRGNPFFVSLDNTHYPGCRALVSAFESLSSLLTLTGPDPAPLAQWAAAKWAEDCWGAAPTSGASSVPPLPPLVDAVAVSAIANALLSGDTLSEDATPDHFRIDPAANVSSASFPSCRSLSLDMPPALTYRVAQVTLSKTKGLLPVQSIKTTKDDSWKESKEMEQTDTYRNFSLGECLASLDAPSTTALSPASSSRTKMALSTMLQHGFLDSNVATLVATHIGAPLLTLSVQQLDPFAEGTNGPRRLLLEWQAGLYAPSLESIMGTEEVSWFVSVTPDCAMGAGALPLAVYSFGSAIGTSPHCTFGRSFSQTLARRRATSSLSDDGTADMETEAGGLYWYAASLPEFVWKLLSAPGTCVNLHACLFRLPDAYVITEDQSKCLSVREARLFSLE